MSITHRQTDRQTHKKYSSEPHKNDYKTYIGSGNWTRTAENLIITRHYHCHIFTYHEKI